MVLDIVINLIGKDEAEIVFSQDTVGELMYVMKNKITHYINEDDQLEFMNAISSLFFYSYTVNTECTKISETIKDKNDVMFLKCAKQSRANYIVSDDFKSGMHDVKTVKVVGSKDFVSIFTSQLEDTAVDEDNK
jgi:putative PIN family toxin of toxin-antitoxin system